MLNFYKILIRNDVQLIKNQNGLTNLYKFSLKSLSTNSAETNSTGSAENSTNFGFKRVKSEEKQGKVNEVFNNVAEKYDIMNDAMSFGLHRLWKNKFIEEIEPNNQMKLIDVAGGTGDIGFRYLSYLKSLNENDFNKANQSNENDKIKVTICDINENMLNVGKERAKLINFYDKIDWKVGNAENLENEKDNSYDVYTIAFGIRNCTNLDKVVKEAYRVLKPGGRFMCLEFSKTNNPFFKRVYDYYSFKMIPVMGYLIAGDWESYQYLVESIRVFPDQDDFASLISDCGFRLVSYKNLTNGAVAIHSGFKF